MKKEEILNLITDENQKKSVSTILDFAEGVAKSQRMTESEFETMLKTKATELEVEVGKVKGLQEQLDKMGAEISAMKEKGGKEEVKTLTDILKSASKGFENFGQSAGDKMSLKVPLSSVAKTTVTMSSITSDNVGTVIPGFGQMKTARPRIASLLAQFPIGANSHGVVYYTDQTTRTSGAAARSAGSAAGESTIAWTGYSAPLQSISDSIPLHRETLSRVSEMEAELRNFITTNLVLAEDNYLLNGTGTPPQIQGIYDLVSAFDSSAYAGFKPKKAALIDLIVVMATEIMKDSSYNVDTCIVNPADALGITLEKDVNGNRINFIMTNPLTGEQMVKGIRIIESAHQTINTLTIGDFTKARRYFGDNINIEFGYNTSGDFTKRIITMLGNMECLCLVRNCEANAFLKSTDIAADILNITEVTA